MTFLIKFSTIIIFINIVNSFHYIKNSTDNIVNSFHYIKNSTENIVNCSLFSNFEDDNCGCDSCLYCNNTICCDYCEYNIYYISIILYTILVFYILGMFCICCLLFYLN